MLLPMDSQRPCISAIPVYGGRKSLVENDAVYDLAGLEDDIIIVVVELQL